MKMDERIEAAVRKQRRVTVLLFRGVMGESKVECKCCVQASLLGENTNDRHKIVPDCAIVTVKCLQVASSQSTLVDVF